MTKEEINKTILSLQTDEEIIDFVKKRIQELEEKSIETTVGQNYTTTFKEYISEKTHYKTGKKLQDAELHKNKYIEKLNLSGNSIKDEGFISICKALKDNKNLEILNISNNDIHSQGLTQGLNLITSCKITSLNLSQNKLQDTGIKILSNSLKFFPNLCKLNLSDCVFEFNGFK